MGQTLSQRRRAISMLTDFGRRDHYVGVMKAVITSINPSVAIIDISHDIPPQNLFFAVHLLRSSYRYFPEESVHLVVVDPGVGGKRRKIAVEAEGHFFVGPDNGILGSLLDGKDVKQAVELKNERFFLHPVSQTFHGRDVFAPVAAHISLGVPLHEFGPPADNLEKIPMASPISRLRGISGQVIYIDHFGNLVTNISAELWQQVVGDRAFTIKIAGVGIAELSSSYDSVSPGVPLAIFGSGGMLEVSISMGNAAKMLKAKIGDVVDVGI